MHRPVLNAPSPVSAILIGTASVIDSIVKHLPIEYRLFLVAVFAFLFLTGAYAIANGAVVAQQIPTSLNDDSSSASSYVTNVSQDDLSWYQETAIWICPLH